MQFFCLFMFQIVAHLATIPSPANVVIRTSDTDVLVIASDVSLTITDNVNSPLTDLFGVR